MKWKLLSGGLLVIACLGLLAIKGISQGPKPDDGQAGKPPPSFPAPPAPQSPFCREVPQDPLIASGPAREKTFEQLAADLKTVRAKQKELKTQEEEILKKMAASVEEKRKDLEKAVQILQQLQGESRSTIPASFSSSAPK